jgi:hypothetical protein
VEPLKHGRAMSAGMRGSAAAAKVANIRAARRVLSVGG